MRTDRSKKILRQYKRYFGDKNFENSIADIAAIVASQDQEKADSLEKFPEFIDAIQNVYEEYEERLKFAARNIEISSKELTTALEELENLNGSINTMLDSLGQALLFFNKDGICSSVFSKACLDIFANDPSNRFLPDFLNFSSKQKATFQSWLDIVFSHQSAMSFDDLKKLLPQEMRNQDDRIIELDYRPMYFVENVISGILLIATDVTYNREAEEKIVREQQRAKTIQLVSQNRNSFYTLIEDVSRLIESIEEKSGDIATTMRTLHTLKGHAASFNLLRLASHLHQMETSIDSNQDTLDHPALKNELEQLKGLLEDKVALARQLFGDNFMSQERVKIINVKTIDDLSAMIEKSVTDPKAQNDLKKYVRAEMLAISIFDSFKPFKRELNRLAEQQGKIIPEFLIEGDNCKILPRDYEDFFGSLIHLARNIIDHGIEPPTERENSNKPEAGIISVAIKQTDKQLVISIQDDGRGIDPSTIRSILAEKGTDTKGETDQEVIYHIFDYAFSSNKSVDSVSGRGIGMNAISDTVEKMKGSYKVESDFANSKGTRFTFTLPYTT